MGIVWQWVINPGLKVCIGYAPQHCLCIAYAKHWLHFAVILALGAVLVVFYSLYYACLDWILMDVSQQDCKVSHIVDRL